MSTERRLKAAATSAFDALTMHGFSLIALGNIHSNWEFGATPFRDLKIIRRAAKVVCKSVRPGHSPSASAKNLFSA
jgi:hypothetical protein